MRKNYKSLLSIALVLLLVAITTLTFAFWDQLTGSESGTINIGQGKRIEVTETVPVPTGKKLIPNTMVQGVDDIYEIKVEYTVTLTEKVVDYQLEAILVTTGNTLLVGNIVIDDADFSESLITTVEVTFSLNEPADEAAYNAVVNNPLSYTITFEYK